MHCVRFRVRQKLDLVDTIDFKYLYANTFEKIMNNLINENKTIYFYYLIFIRVIQMFPDIIFPLNL